MISFEKLQTILPTPTKPDSFALESYLQYRIEYQSELNAVEIEKIINLSSFRYIPEPNQAKFNLSEFFGKLIQFLDF